MLSTKSAINSNLFHMCFTGDSPPIQFKIKILSFNKLDLDDLDEPERINNTYDLSQGSFWILRFEIVSLYKEIIKSSRIHDDILIIDNDDFKFKKSIDYYLISYKDYSDKIEFEPFLDMDLVPKIKYTGAIPYYLPNEEDVEYYVGIFRGLINDNN